MKPHYGMEGFVHHERISNTDKWGIGGNRGGKVPFLVLLKFCHHFLVEPPLARVLAILCAP